MHYGFEVDLNLTKFVRSQIAQVMRPYVLDGGALAGVRDLALQAGLPPNLVPLRHDIDVDAVFDLMRDEGIPLAPVPRASIAVELLAAEGSVGRRAVLDTRSSEIAEDCTEVFMRTSDNPLAGFAQEGVEALLSDLPSAAQALFTVITGTIIDNLGFANAPGWKQALRRIDRNEDKAPKYELQHMPSELNSLPGYEYWVAAPLWHALPSALFKKGEELPNRWARHASTHAVSAVHYNVPNAVIAMMTVAALLDLLDLYERREDER